jgi:hypothetical protein
MQPRRFQVFESIDNALDAGFLLLSVTQYHEAEQEFKKGVALSKRIHGPCHENTIRGVYGLLEAYDLQHRYDDAELLAMDLVETAKTSFGEKNKETLRALSYYAAMVSKQTRWDDAEEIFSVVERNYNEVCGKTYQGTLLAMVRRANNMLHQGSLREGRNYSDDIFKRLKEASEAPLPYNRDAIHHILWFKRLRKRWNDAEELLSPLWQLSRDVQGEAHPETLTIMLCLANLHNYNRELKEVNSKAALAKGSRMLEEVAEISLRVLGPQHVFTKVSNAEIKHMTILGRYKVD